METKAMWLPRISEAFRVVNMGPPWDPLGIGKSYVFIPGNVRAK
jgi:hypothetical protein